MESMQRMIIQVTNEMIYSKKIKGEGRKPFKSFLTKKTNTDSTPQIPPSLGINLEDYERTCPEFINSFTTMILPLEPPKKESKLRKKRVIMRNRKKRMKKRKRKRNIILPT